MKGLLRKELYMLMSGTGLLFVVATLFFAVSGGLNPERGGIQSFAFIYVPLGAYSLMSMEEKWRWPNFLKCTPVTLGQIVAAKYIMSGAQMAVSAVVFGGLNLIFCNGESLGWMLFLLSLGLISAAIVYPLLYWKGPDKGWISAMFCIILLGCFGASLAPEFLDEGLAVLNWGMAHSWILPIVGLALYILSCPLAAKLYKLRK